METLATGLYGTSAAAYTLAAFAHVVYLYRREWEQMARWTTRSAYFLHLLSVAMLIWQTGKAPVYSAFGGVLVVTWLVMFAYVAYESFLGNQSAGPFLVPIVFVLVVGATALPKPGAEAQAFHFPASLLVWHVSIILLGYGLFLGASILSAMYLLLERRLRRKAMGSMVWRLPSLETLDVWSHRLVGAGVPLLSLGLLAGATFAEIFAVQGWTTDVKVLWSVVTWLVFAGYLAIRQFYGWGGRRAAWWSLGGLAGIAINYFVVSPFFPSFHRWGL